MSDVLGWVVIAVVCVVGAIVVLGVAWAYFALMEIAKPWGWSSLLILALVAFVFLHRNTR
jgi:hypothetical protein